MSFSRPRLLRRGLLALLCGVLVASLALNVLLYRQSAHTYEQLQQLHLDPTAARSLEKANAELTPPAAGQKRVVLFGDSRIAMWGPLPHTASAQFVNRGVNGETTEQLLLRLDRDVLALKPDVVVLEMGINDLKTIGVLPYREADIINSCNRNTDLILERLRRQGIEVILLTIFPPGRVALARRPVWSDKTLDAASAFNRRMLGMNRPGVTVVDCDTVLSDGNRMRPEYALDTLHVNPAGYAALDRLIEPVLARVSAADGTGRK